MDARFVSDFAEALSQLKNPSTDLDAGLLAATLDVLEAEFWRVLMENSAPSCPRATASYYTAAYTNAHGDTVSANLHA